MQENLDQKKLRIWTHFTQCGVVSFYSKDNANTFCRFFSDLTDALLQKLQRPKNKFGVKTTECEDFVLKNADVATVDKFLKNLYVTKTSGIDHISTKLY